ncbi:MAG: hypothetical protein LM590_15645, partial [Thermofilum sp.]|nr:hypothetical protein [Thermofilum sp.]
VSGRFSTISPTLERKNHALGLEELPGKRFVALVFIFLYTQRGEIDSSPRFVLYNGVRELGARA